MMFDEIEAKDGPYYTGDSYEAPSIVDLGPLKDLTAMGNFVDVSELVQGPPTIEEVIDQIPSDDIVFAFQDEEIVEDKVDSVLGKRKLDVGKRILVRGKSVRGKSGWKIKWKNVAEQFVRCILCGSGHEFDDEAAKDLRMYAEGLTKGIDEKSGAGKSGVPHVYISSLRDILEEKSIVDRLHPTLKGVSFPRNMFTNMQNNVDGLGWDKTIATKQRVFFYLKD